MNTTIICPLTAAQIEALIAWHHAQAYHLAVGNTTGDFAKDAATIDSLGDHWCAAADLRRRLIDAQERTEDHT